MDIGDTHSTSRDCLGNTQVIHTLVIYFFITIKPPPLRCSTCSLVVIGTVISLDRSDFIDTIYSLQVGLQLNILVSVFLWKTELCTSRQS